MTALTTVLMTILAGILSLYSGSTFTSVMGTEETKDNLILKVTTEGNTKTVSLDGYSVLNYKNVSITGIVVVDGKGNIIDFRDAKITGAPSKVKTVTGVIADDHADIILKGKAAGIVNYEVHYRAKRCEQ